jgi:queuine tRNA-ribosyltransferase
MTAGEPLAGTLNSIHNLAFYLGIMRRVRQSLQDETGVRSRVASNAS